MWMERFLEVFDIGLEQFRICYDSANIGPSIGTMDLAKVDNKQHVSLVGMNDGTMPQP